MTILSVNQIIDRLKTDEPALYALAAKQDFKLPSDDSKPLNLALSDREALQDEANKIASEIHDLATLASNLLIMPAAVARRSHADQKNWQQQQKIRPRLRAEKKGDNLIKLAAEEEPRIIDEHLIQRPYEVFATGFNKNINHIYGVPENLRMNEKHILYNARDINKALNTLFSQGYSCDINQTISSVSHQTSSLAGNTQSYLVQLHNYLDHFNNKKVDSKLHPYCLSACRFCIDVIYPNVMERAEQLSALLEQLQKKEARIVQLQGLRHQGNVTALPGVTLPASSPGEVSIKSNVTPLFPRGNGPTSRR
jgi:hypothetical protein